VAPYASSMPTEGTHDSLAAGATTWSPLFC